MRFYACEQCRHVYQVAGDMESVKSLFQNATNFPCVTNLCQGRVQRVQSLVPGFTSVEVPLYSFFRAINGFGLSSGAPASAAKFVEVVKTKKIVNAVVEPIGQPERVIVKQLICEDGTRLHFDTSARGACCYFIEEPGPSCVEVFDAECSSDAESAGRGSDPVREETGRAPQADGSIANPRGSTEPPANAATSEQSRTDNMSSVPEACDVPETPSSCCDGNVPRVTTSIHGVDSSNVRM